MSTIKLDGSSGFSDTLVPNRFLDYYMPNANGEFVKIYLYLLRALSCADCDISISHIADVFNHTDKDVIRALKYWEKMNLVDLCFDSDKSLTAITLKPVNVDYMTDDGTYIEVHSTKTAKSDKNEDCHNDKNSSSDAEQHFSDTNGKEYSAVDILPDKGSAETNSFINSSSSERRTTTATKHEKHTYTANELNAFKSTDEVCEFLYLAEKYIGKTLSGADVNSLVYIYDVLGFEPELIEYLIEYCVTNGHKSLRYIEKVALSWADEGITSVELARAHTTLFSKNCYPVLKAFGLSGRNPGAGEKAMIVKWTTTYGFDMDIILDACNRTIDTIHQPSFEYADSILSKWKEKGIRTLSDVKSLDDEYIKNKAAKNFNPAGKSSSKSSSDTKSKNSFNNFEQRSYDYEQLEKKLLNNGS